MKKITYLSAAILIMVCGYFAACSDDNATSGIPVTGITLAEAEAGGELTVKTRATLKVTAAVSPDNASYKRVLFESSNPAIMTVTQAGVITGVRTGTATLRAFAADGSGVSADYPVFVDYEAGVTNVRTPGTLSQLLGSTAGITSLKLAGTLNAADFATLTALTALQTLDMSLTTVTAIPANALAGASALTTVILPATLATIGENAFKDCTALTSITLEAAAPPTAATGAFGGITLSGIALSVPDEAAAAYRQAAPWKSMRVNGAEPGLNVANYTIQAAAGNEQWVAITLPKALRTTDEWEIKAVSVHTTYDPSTITGKSFNGWGCHLLDLAYTGTIDSGFGTGSGKPLEFYFGGPSQGGTKVGAVGRGNWNSTTHSLAKPAVTLNTPLTIIMKCNGTGIACTVQNEGLGDGTPINFKTITSSGGLTITAIRAALPVTTALTVTTKEE
jgi:hypothetical protein